MESDFKIGSVVLSKAGHDKHNLFIIVEVVDSEYVKIADGRTRTLAKPKLKKTKHLKLLGVELTELASRLVTGEKIYDKHIKTALKECKD